MSHRRIVLNTGKPTYGDGIANKKTGFYEPHTKQNNIIEYKPHTYKQHDRQGNAVLLHSNIDFNKKPHTYSRAKNYDHYYDYIPGTTGANKKKKPKPVKPKTPQPEPKQRTPTPVTPPLPYSAVGAIHRMDQLLNGKSPYSSKQDIDVDDGFT